MACKVCFLPSEKFFYTEESVNFTYVKGMAFSQKQKNVLSFHSSIQEKFPQKKILEVSTKSNYNLGVKLSAFNLKLNGFPVENIFQSSKVFEGEIQHKHLLFVSPQEAKKVISEQSEKLICFRYKDQTFPLTPKSLFYDYIYINALKENLELGRQLMEFDIFTDIEFNEKKSINCQARSCAIYVSLRKRGLLDHYTSNIELFKQIYSNQTFEAEQISMFGLL